MVNKSVFLSLLVIGVVAAAAGAGTWAYYVDTETSANTLTAGQMDLTVALTDGDAASVETLSIGTVYPGATGTLGTVTLSTLGVVGGTVKVDVDPTSIEDFENGYSEPEAEELGLTIADGATDTTGELGEYVTITFTSATSGAAVGSLKLDGTTTTPISLPDMDADDSEVITVNYEISADATNTIQTDSVSFDFVFTMNQDETPAAV